jgi:hypothetical protein
MNVGAQIVNTYEQRQDAISSDHDFSFEVITKKLASLGA